MQQKMEELKGVSKEKQAEILQLLGKNAQRSHQINAGGMNQQLGGAFAGLFGAANPNSQPTASQAPMQGIFPGLFPMAQQQPNLMQAFPFMAPQPQPAYGQPMYAQNRGMPINPAPRVNAYPPSQQQINPQANPLNALNMGNMQGQINRAHPNQYNQRGGIF